MKLPYKLVLLFLLIISARIHAESGNAFVVHFPPNSRAAALGGSVAALTRTVNGLAYNPASPAGIWRTEFAFTFDIRNDGLFLPTFSFSMPVGKKIFLSYASINLVKIKTNYTLQPNHNVTLPADFNYSGASIIGISAGPFKGLSFGASLKLFTEFNGSGNDNFDPAVDLGFLYTFTGIPLTLGFSIQNIIFKMDSRYETETIPFILRIGGSWSIIKKVDNKLDLFFSFEKTEDLDLQAAIGSEYTINDKIVFRMGYHMYDSFPSFGFGFKNINVDISLHIDLAIQYQKESGLIFTFSAGIDF